MSYYFPKSFQMEINTMLRMTFLQILPPLIYYTTHGFEKFYLFLFLFRLC